MKTCQFLLFILFLFGHVQAQQTCQSYIDGLFSKYPDQLLDLKTLTEQEKFYVQFSGREGYLDLGQRALCEAQPSMKYYVLLKLDGVNAHYRMQAETGICVIKECTMDTLGTDDLQMRQLFKLNNWDIGNSPVELYDVNQDVPKDAPFYLNAIFQAMLAFLGIGSTIIVYQRARDSRNKGEAQPKANHWLVQAFDIKASLKSLYQTAKEQKQNENLATFSFLRVFASWWVAGLHTLFYHMRVVAHWKPDDIEGFHRFFLQGNLAVDYFFFMGGFLAVYVLTSKFQKEELTFKTFFHHMKHRILRVWALCMISVAFYALMMVYMFKGPMWGRYSGIVPYCRSLWWQKLLLIDNLIYKEGGNCFTVGWYTSIDLQSYALVIVIIFLYAKSRAGGYIGAILVFVISYLTAQDRMGGNQFSRYYIYTPARVAEIFVGVIFGMQYYDYAKHKAKLNFYWLCDRFIILKYLVMAAGSYVIYYLAYYIQTLPESDFATTEMEGHRERVACISVAMVSVIAVQHRCYVKMFFRLRIWQIMGKLSYGLYLFHTPVILALLFTRDQGFKTFNISEFVGIYFQVLAITYCVCIIYYVFFERPLFAIEAHFNKNYRQVGKELQTKGIQIVEQSPSERNKNPNANGENAKLLPLSDLSPLLETGELKIYKKVEASSAVQSSSTKSGITNREELRPESGSSAPSASEKGLETGEKPNPTPENLPKGRESGQFPFLAEVPQIIIENNDIKNEIKIEISSVTPEIGPSNETKGL